MSTQTTAASPRTLPPRAYVDPDLFAREMDEVFAKAWTLAGHASELTKPGSFITSMVGREPVMVIRGHDGELRAMSNVCRHRGSILLEGTGSVGKAIRCPYHGWTYKDDGSLGAVPQARGYSALDQSAICLPSYRVADIEGLLFVCTDPSQPAAEQQFSEVIPFWRSLGLRRRVVIRWKGTANPARYVDRYSLNWKTLLENYQESYHVPVGHPSLVRLLDIKKTESIYGDWAGASWVPLRQTPSKVLLERLYRRLIRPMPEMPERFQGKTWGNAYFWPATCLEIYPHHIDSWQLNPIEPDLTTATTFTLVDPDSGWRAKASRRLVNHLQGEVMKEDELLVDRVKIGLRAPSYQPGQLNDETEWAVISFQRTLRGLLPEVDEP